MGIKVLKRLLNFKLASTMGGMLSQLEWAFYGVRGNILEITMATIIRNAEGEVIDAVERAKMEHLQTRWKKARKELQRCTKRLGKIRRFANKFQRIITIVRRAVKVGSKVGRFIPGAAKAIAQLLDKAEKILTVINTMLKVVVRVVDILRNVCDQLLSQLRELRSGVDISEEEEQQLAEEVDNESLDPIDVFNEVNDNFFRNIDLELDGYEDLLQELEDLRNPENENECKRRLNDSLSVLEALDEFIGDVENLRRNNRNIISDIDDESITTIINDSVNKVLATRDLISNFRDELLDEGREMSGSTRPDVNNNAQNIYLEVGGEPNPGTPIEEQIKKPTPNPSILDDTVRRARQIELEKRGS